MVTLLCLVLLAIAGSAQARTLQARIDRVDTAVATLDDVVVRLHWPADAAVGTLRLSARSFVAADLGYRFRDVVWECPLSRDGQGGWHCAGVVHSAVGRPLRLSVNLDPTRTLASLSRGVARIDLRRPRAVPDLATSDSTTSTPAASVPTAGNPTAIDLTAVPAAWVQAMLTQVWEAPRLQSGTLDARLQLNASEATLRVDGELLLDAIDFDTPDGRIAGQGIDGRFDIDYRKRGVDSTMQLDGTLSDGELLFGNTYLALQNKPVGVDIDARGRAGEGWRLPDFVWRDEGVLLVGGSAAFAADASLRELDVRVRSDDIAPLRDRYLSGWLGLAGLGDIELSGSLDADLRMGEDGLQEATLHLHGVDLDDPEGRFALRGLDGDVRLTSGERIAIGTVGWDSGTLYGLPFQSAELVLESRNGTMRLRDPVSIAMLGGSVRLDSLAIRPPAAGESLSLGFGLGIDALDIGSLSEALDWPAFRGTVSGDIPDARYIDDRLDFDGGLTMQLFDGEVRVRNLSLERPFGSAPTLSADIAIDGLDLWALTEVFGFGSISGRLDGRIDDLRLVGWQPTAFDGALYTVRTPGVRQRISQRAVQNISSVGDASFANSLQGRLIGLFDDFGYSRIGISCRLANQVCEMGGLRSGGNTFTIVTGAGLPRLTVIGHNRLVDWPLLIERLAAVGKGEVQPVIE